MATKDDVVMAGDIGVSFYERTYTLEQLQLLRDCWDANKGLSQPLTSTMMTFIGSHYHGDNDDIIFWLRFLEKIQVDRDFPEKEFSPDRKMSGTSFVIRPNPQRLDSHAN